MTISQANPSMLQPPDGYPRENIVLVAPERREEAVGRLLASEGAADPNHARRFLDYTRSHAVSLEHLWGVLDQSDRFLAVVLAVPNPGRSGMIFASQTRTQGEIALVGRLLDFACERLAQIGLHLAQALLETDELPAHEAFKRGGFQSLATLSYLERPLRSRLLPPQPRWHKGVTIGPYDDSLRKELVSVLDATYEETLDCPGLRGHRSTSDILDGHLAVGDFDPALWTILHVDHEPAGILLLNPAADHASIELVYLGLAKRARHRGLGRSLLRHGLHITAARPERLMTLAVDEANEPALSLYKREHFRKVLRRAAMIRPLRATIA